MINIVLSSDNNYAQHLAVTITSILKNTKSAHMVRFFVLDSGISETLKAQIQKGTDDLMGNVIFIPMNTDLTSHGFVSGHLSKAAYNRLFLDELLPQSVAKVIYLDVDLLVQDDIEKLWQVDLEGRTVGAVLDLGIISSKRMVKDKLNNLGFSIINDGYFNSGVLVIDLEKWREEKCGEKLMELINTNSFRHHDQDALNKLFHSEWKVLPLRWNVIPPVYYLFLKIIKNKKLRDIAVEAKKNPAIIHFAGRTKPWEFPLIEGYNDLYYKYLKLSSFCFATMPQPSDDMHGKSAWRQKMRGKISNVVLSFTR